MEEQALRALDQKLDTLGSAAASDECHNAVPASGSGHAHRPQQESAAALEDSQRRTEEQSGGQGLHPESLVASVEARKSQGEDRTSSHRQLMQSSSAWPVSQWQQLEEAGRQLEEVCRVQPYRPEDHTLTAEEMWGDTSDEDGTGRGVTDGGGRASASAAPERSSGQPLEETVLTAEEMWGGLSDDEGGAPEKDSPADSAPASLRQAEPLPPPQPLPTPAAGSANLSDAERLARLLAGPEAPQTLGRLRFAELTAVAEDCQKAVETLRWVLTRQHEMASAAGL